MITVMHHIKAKLHEALWIRPQRKWTTEKTSITTQDYKAWPAQSKGVHIRDDVKLSSGSAPSGGESMIEKPKTWNLQMPQRLMRP